MNTPGRFWVRLSLAVFWLSGCTPMPPRPERSQLEIREAQTRSYPQRKGQFTRVMKALIDVLQDEGYIIKNADRELGYITAAKEVDVENAWASAFIRFGAGSGGSEPRYRKNSVTECSVNVSDRGNEVKVRAVFQRKVLDNLGGTMAVDQIEDPRFYQDFFSKVDKGLYIDRQDL